MGVSVISNIIVTGQPDRLRDIAASFRVGTDAVESIAFSEVDTLELATYNGVGGLLHYHGQRIATAYPDVVVRGSEFYDCCEDPTLARWDGGKTTYLCDLYCIFSFGVPDTGQPVVRLWESGEGVAQALADWNLGSCFTACAERGEIAPRWHHMASGGVHLLLRRPSDASADGLAIWLEPWGGHVTFIQGIDSMGVCQDQRRENVAWVSRRFPEIRAAQRKLWRGEAETRRSGRRQRSLWKRLMRRTGEKGGSGAGLVRSFDPDEIVF